MGDDEANDLGGSGDDEADGQAEEETLEGIAPPADEEAAAAPTGWLGSTTPIAPPPPPPPPARRGRLPLVAAVLALLIGAAVAALIAFGGSSTHGPVVGVEADGRPLAEPHRSDRPHGIGESVLRRSSTWTTSRRAGRRSRATWCTGITAWWTRFPATRPPSTTIRWIRARSTRTRWRQRRENSRRGSSG